MKELEQLIQKLELEQLTTQDRLRLTKRIIQLAEEDNQNTKHSVYHSLLMLVDNQIALENIIKETSQEFEAALKRSHNAIMDLIKRATIENEKFIEEIKKNFQKQEENLKPLLENYNKNQVTGKTINQYMDIIIKISGFVTASIIVYSAVRYILTL